MKTQWINIKTDRKLNKKTMTDKAELRAYGLRYLLPKHKEIAKLKKNYKKEVKWDYLIF